MKAVTHLLTAILFVIANVFNANADVRLPAIFGNNMVLQQQTQVAVWGWAKANSTVTVSGSWNGKSYSARSNAQGYWKVKIATPAAGFTPYSLTVSDGKAITLKNILIGEVWVCSGQSNMEMPMKGFGGQPIDGGPNDIANSTNPAIRCFTVTKAAKGVPQDDCSGAWEAADPQTTPNFTATGYYFARLLNKALNIPVGFIHTSWGGTPVFAWTSAEALKGVPEKPIVIPQDETKINSWTTTALYNGMIHPIVGYGIRGAIWYQGESNRDEPDLYVKMFDAMVRGWRNDWGVGEFPFYYCQIAPYNYGGGLNSGFIREAQAKGMTTTPNTGMAVLMDAESQACIHPPKKKDAGERMALWALAKTYGMDKIHYRSPEVKSVEVEGRIMNILFDMFGSSNGLTTKGKELRGFRIAGEDKRFHYATAVLRHDRVFVFSPEVPKPVAVRYCFDDTSDTELFTVEGNLPVSSFRTDDWR